VQEVRARDTVLCNIPYLSPDSILHFRQLLKFARSLRAVVGRLVGTANSIVILGELSVLEPFKECASEGGRYEGEEERGIAERVLRLVILAIVPGPRGNRK